MELNEYDRKVIHNGCKPAWFPKGLNANFCFKKACNQHDLAYYYGWAENDRKKADKVFYKNMKKAIKKTKAGWLKKMFYKVMAYKYYKLVRWFGKSAFNYAPMPLPSTLVDKDEIFEYNEIMLIQGRWFTKSEVARGTNNS